MLNNLDKIKPDDRPLPRPTGSRADVAREYLRRCDEREKFWAEEAIKAEREGDHDGTWLAMATRAENNRARVKFAAFLAEHDAWVGKHGNIEILP